MTLAELLARHAQPAPSGVPDWMLGFYKRHAISFADGTTDCSTHVCWLQSRNFTIDLRLPLAADQAPAKRLAAYSAAELQLLANNEGWVADAEWDGRVLRWRPTEVSLQLHDRWPEPAILHRVGNCMVEFCDSGAYVEDWRLQPSAPGPLIGLRLVEEREAETGRLRHRGGGLIVCGDHAALVLGRDSGIAAGGSTQLRQLVAEADGDAARLAQLFHFETSVAHGRLGNGFEIVHSTQPLRVGQPLFAPDGFEFLPATQHVLQRLQVDGVAVERIFTIDTLEAEVSFAPATGFTASAAAWFAQESPTLRRYTQVLS